jgi:hypothetical protein
MTSATNRWRVVGDEICNPQNEVVPRIVANLPSIQRQETINHIEHAPRRAYERAGQMQNRRLKQPKRPTIKTTETPKTRGNSKCY